jgi:hypothetical protein
MMIIGYRIPNSTHGQPLTIPDFCHAHITEQVADEVAERLRQQQGREPNWQTVRGALIRLAKSKQANS